MPLSRKPRLHAKGSAARRIPLLLASMHRPWPLGTILLGWFLAAGCPLAAAEAPSNFPRFSMAGQEAEARLLSNYLWYHFSTRLGHGKAPFNMEYLTTSDLWMGGALHPGEHFRGTRVEGRSPFMGLLNDSSAWDVVINQAGTSEGTWIVWLIQGRQISDKIEVRLSDDCAESAAIVRFQQNHELQ